MFANFILPELDHKCSEVFEFEISENEAIKQSIRLPGSKTEKNLKTSCVFKTQTSIEEVLICKKERLRESGRLYLSQTIQIQLCLCNLTELCRAQLWQGGNQPVVQSNHVGHLSDRVQRVHEGLPQLPCLPGLHQRQEPRRGGAGRGEPAATVAHGEGGALHEHPACRGS